MDEELRWRDLDMLLTRPGNITGPGFEPGPECRECLRDQVSVIRDYALFAHDHFLFAKLYLSTSKYAFGVPTRLMPPVPGACDRIY